MGNRVLKVAAINSGDGDVFGWVQGWRFAIAQLLTDMGQFVPDFRGADDVREWFEYEELVSLGHTISEGDLLYSLTILDRYREWLRLAGRDY